MGQHNGLDPPANKQTEQINVEDTISSLSNPSDASSIVISTSEGNKGKKVVLPIWIYFYSGIASFMSFTFGFNSAIVAAAIIFIPKINAGEMAAIVSIMLFGALLGSLSAGPLSDLTGRKPTLLLNYLFAFVAALGSGLATGTWQLILWRFVVGFGAGVASVVPALYITEIGPASIRGLLSTGNQLAGSLGIVIAYFVGATIVACDTRECWRWMFGSGIILAVLGFLGTLFIPESPRWLLACKGSREEARMVLEKVYGILNEPACRTEYRKMCDQLVTARSGSLSDEGSRWRDLGRRQYRRPLLIACLLLPLLQGLSGNTTLVYYTAVLLTTSKVASGKAVLYTALTGLPQPVVLVAVLFLMDRLGRKLLLLLSIAGTCISALTLGVLFYLSHQQQMAHSVGLLLMIVLFRTFYALGLGPVPQVLGPEILPFPVRARGTAISLGVYWLTVGIIAAAFPPLLRHLPPYVVYWFFAGCLLIFLFLVLHFVRGDTAARSLEEIECVHHLPVIAPDGSNRADLPADSMASKLRPVTIILPPNDPN